MARRIELSEAETTTAELARRCMLHPTEVNRRLKAAGVRPVDRRHFRSIGTPTHVYDLADALAAVAAGPVRKPKAEPPAEPPGSATVAEIAAEAGVSANTVRERVTAAGIAPVGYRRPKAGSKLAHLYDRAAALAVVRTERKAVQRGWAHGLKLPGRCAVRESKPGPGVGDGPVVLYGLLTAADADELGRRRSKFDAARLATDVRRAAA